MECDVTSWTRKLLSVIQSPPSSIGSLIVYLSRHSGFERRRLHTPWICVACWSFSSPFVTALHKVYITHTIIVKICIINAILESGCNYVISSEAGYITSPNYPDNYDDYSECRWLITTNQTHRVVVYFVGNFTTQTGFDRLTVMTPDPYCREY